MKVLKYTGPVLFISLLVLHNLGCSSAMGNTRILNSITVTPSTADAQNFVNGQVQFVATGNFNSAPTPVTPLTEGGWVSMNPNIATVDHNGLAECVAGASGTVDILKQAARGGTAPLATSTVVNGSARLTCP